MHKTKLMSLVFLMPSQILHKKIRLSLKDIKNRTKTVVTLLQWNLGLRKPDLRKNLDLRKIVGVTDFLVHKLFDLGKIF